MGIEKHNIKENKENPDIDTADNSELNTCSSCDCTGLIPSAVADESEAQAYEQLYPYLPPENN